MSETTDRWDATIEAFARKEIGAMPSTIIHYMQMVYRDLFGVAVPYCSCSSRFRDAAIKIVAEWNKKKKKRTKKADDEDKG